MRAVNVSEVETQLMKHAGNLVLVDLAHNQCPYAYVLMCLSHGFQAVAKDTASLLL